MASPAFVRTLYQPRGRLEVSSTCRAFAPATVANLACGFDVLGLALERPGDTVEASLTSASSSHAAVQIATIEGDEGRLPRQAERNSAGAAVKALLKRHPSSDAITLKLWKRLPIASGLGGSAASAVAAVVAVKELLGLDISEDELLAFALEGERAVSGSAHADNVAACFSGGLVLVRASSDGRPAPPPNKLEKLSVIRLPVPDGLSVAVVRPHIELSTKESRALLGEAIPLTAAVQQWGNLGAFIAGLHQSNWAWIRSSLVDHVAEPQRAGRVPGFHKVQEAALSAGALGSSLSGSGPSIFALCESFERAEQVASEMSATLKRSSSLDSDRYVSPVATRGAHVL